MITKEHADAISDLLINSSSRSSAKAVIPRSYNGMPIAFIFPTTLFFMFNARRAEQFPIWVWASCGVIMLMVIFIALYQLKTPLLKIEDEVLTFYGLMPYQKKSFPVAEITDITFSIPLHIWRSARSLVIRTANDHCQVWIVDRNSSDESAQVQKIRQLFKGRFDKRYLETRV